MVAPTEAPLVVVNANDGGPGSLRQAIIEANAAAGMNTITFNLPAIVPQAINPMSPLPVITDAVFIDGASQPGYSGTPFIILDGSDAGPGDGLAITSGNSRVRGLSIVGFSGSAIALNFLTGSIIQGNYLGLLPDGITAFANDDGVSMVDASSNTVGGTTPPERNVISGNSGSGVKILGDLSDGNRVYGNYIGTDASGMAAIPNQGVQGGVFDLQWAVQRDWQHDPGIRERHLWEYTARCHHPRAQRVRKPCSRQLHRR